MKISTFFTFKKEMYLKVHNGIGIQDINAFEVHNGSTSKRIQNLSIIIKTCAKFISNLALIRFNISCYLKQTLCNKLSIFILQVDSLCLPMVESAKQGKAAN